MVADDSLGSDSACCMLMCLFRGCLPGCAPGDVADALIVEVHTPTLLHQCQEAQHSLMHLRCTAGAAASASTSTMCAAASAMLRRCQQGQTRTPWRLQQLQQQWPQRLWLACTPSA
jgi:hypothetical protein